MGPGLKLKQRDEAALQDFALRVRSTLGDRLMALKLFGSKATGLDAPDLDIDVLVVVNEVSVDVEDRILAIAFDVNLTHDVYISPRVIGRATLEDPIWSNTPFLQAVMREGFSL